jgi:sodium/potassium-transporting ATPase subunit alpha
MELVDFRKKNKGLTSAQAVAMMPEVKFPQRFKPEEVAIAYGTSAETGLAPEEVIRRTQFYGPNMVLPAKENPLWIKFIISLFSGFGTLLFVAGSISFLTYIPLGEPNPAVYNLALAIVIWAVQLLQGGFGFYQEYQAGNVLKSFRNMIPLQTSVVRGGVTEMIVASALTVGDIVNISVGCKLPADLRLIEVRNLKVDNSSLTGESDPVRCTTAACNTELLEARNMLFLGTSVVEGSGVAVVVAVGSNCEMGRIMTVAANTSSQTPLNREIFRIVCVITTLAFITGTVVTLGWYFWLSVDHPSYMNSTGAIMNVIGVLVVYIPEGLPIAVTVGLALIAKRLCKKYNVLVTKLGTVETLGCVSLIASDKTGTLTQSKMTITNVIVGGVTHEIKDENRYASVGVKSLLRSGVLCNPARITVQGGKEEIVGGNGVDVAILNCATHLGLRPAELSQCYNLLGEIPFSSSTKYAVTVHRANSSHTDDGISVTGKNPFVSVKGAPEILFQKCTNILNDDGTTSKLTPEMQKSLFQTTTNYGEMGHRLIAIAMLELNPTQFPAYFQYNTDTPNFPIADLTLLGIVSISDPPRKEVPDAIRNCRNAKVRVVMVTGDHHTTGLAIAKQVGIITRDQVDNIYHFPADEYRETEGGNDDGVNKYYIMNLLRSFASCCGSLFTRLTEKVGLGRDSTTGDSLPKKTYKYDYRNNCIQRGLVITGNDLVKFTEGHWNWALKYEQIVFARTTPDHKLAIVSEFQKRGHTVAVTGDGANDAPALKKADVGVAMHSGSDVARDSADIILLTNDFTAIVTGIREGRLVFTNLQKLISYLLPAGNFSELLPALANVFLGMPLPLSTFLMIVICVFTDLFGSLSLMYEHPEADIMEHGPRDRRTDSLLSMRVLTHACLFIGVIESTAAFFMYFWFFSRNGVSPGDLMFAWDFADSDGYAGLSADELVSLLNTSESVYFVTLVVCQLGNLLAVRKSAPYFIGFGARIKDFIQDPKKYKKFFTLYIAACIAEISWALVFTQGAAFQQIFFTTPVTYEYWLCAFGFSAGVFLMDEFRKLFVKFFLPNF